MFHLLSTRHPHGVIIIYLNELSASAESPSRSFLLKATDDALAFGREFHHHQHRLRFTV